MASIILGAAGFIGAILLFVYIAKERAKPRSYTPSLSTRERFEQSDKTTVPYDRRAAYRDYLKSQEWYALRKKVLKRDGYRCTQCGYIGKLQAHHVHYDGIYDMEFTVDQLITVCIPCHEKIHGRR